MMCLLRRRPPQCRRSRPLFGRTIRLPLFLICSILIDAHFGAVDAMTDFGVVEQSGSGISPDLGALEGRFFR